MLASFVLLSCNVLNAGILWWYLVTCSACWIADWVPHEVLHGFWKVDMSRAKWSDFWQLVHVVQCDQFNPATEAGGKDNDVHSTGLKDMPQTCRS
jgi:hypothetical protein